MHIPRPAKLLFQHDNAWNTYLEKHAGPTSANGRHFPWSACSPAAPVPWAFVATAVLLPLAPIPVFFGQSCKSEACSACGMKATEQWIATQQHVLPDCDWQHITFTMPHLLWPFFNNNWPLLNDLFRCATRAMLRFARKLGIEIGIFCALHTYDRQLGQHPHIHLSVTRGGLSLKHGVWRSLFFKKKVVEQIWRIAVIRLMRKSYGRPLRAMAICAMSVSGDAIWRHSTVGTGKCILRRRHGEPGAM